MNTTKWALSGLALLALAAMTPTANAGLVEAEAHVQVPANFHVCVFDPFAQGSATGVLWPTNGCGSAKDSWVTVSGPIIGCVTTYTGHPTSGC